jgi:signal peptidase II
LGAIPRTVGSPIAGKARSYGREARMTSHPRPNALSWLALSVVVVVLDQLTKLWVLTSLPEYTAIPVIDGFWNWYRTYNTGAAFSFLADAGGWQHWFFIGIGLVICAVLAVWLARTPRHDWRTALPFALVIGGAVGNLIDRFVHGHVVDFIQWHWRDWYWPAFNIADAAIVGGAIGIAVFGLVQGRSAGSSRPR